MTVLVYMLLSYLLGFVISYVYDWMDTVVVFVVGLILTIFLSAIYYKVADLEK